MKNISIIILSIAILLSACSNQEIMQGIGTANTILGGSGNAGLTETEVIAGLKEALSVGTDNSSNSLSKPDGFYKNPLVSIPFPPDAIKVKNTVEDVGFEPQVEKFVLTLNRAAEQATKEAAPIFLNAIKEMSVQDAFTILKGTDDAATNYLKDKTYNSLQAKFEPKVQSAIATVELTKQWEPIINKYNAITLFTGGEKINPDLEAYVTEKAIDGLFSLIALEEKKIRENPAARVTDLLKKVFGS